MTITRSLCLVLSVLSLLTSAAFATAPHPTVLTVKYKGEFVPVVRVKGTNPYVKVDGKEVMIRSEPIYLVQEAPGFSNNYITVPDGTLGGKMRHQLLDANTYDSSALHQGQIDLNMSLTAQETMKDGFVAVVLLSSSGPSDVIVQQLPELPAGQRVKVKLSVHALPHELDPTFFAQIFDETGREVLNNEIGYAWQYYAARDRVRVAAAVKKYLEENKGADHAPVPAYTPKPVFRPGSVLPEGEITVQLSISDEGLVTNVDAGMIGDDRARNSVIEALSGWLFMPKLKAGQPVYSYINVPLQF